MKCLICNSNEADDLGSHIIPHSIIESMINEDGVVGRDKEQSFKIGASSSDFKFGRKLLPEKLEAIVGRSLTEDEIEQNIIKEHYIMRNVFCSICEKRLSYLESLYKTEVFAAIENERALSTEQLQIFSFFWLSIILRCSVTEYDPAFKLGRVLEADVKGKINEILSSSQSETRVKCVETRFNYALLTLVNVKHSYKSSNYILLHPGYSNPYLLIFNEYLLFFNYSNEQLLEAAFNIIKLPYKGQIPRVQYLDEDSWEKVNYYGLTIKIENFKNEVLSRFSDAFFLKHRTRPLITLGQAFLHEVIYGGIDDDPNQYGEERIARLIQKYVG